MTGRNFSKFFLATLTIVSSLLVFYFWQKLLVNLFALVLGNNFHSLTVAGFFALSAILFLSFVSLFNLLVKHEVMRLAVYGVTALIFAGFTIFLPLGVGRGVFNPRLLVIAAASGLALWLILWHYSHSSQKAVEEHVIFRAGHIFGPRMGTLFTFLGIILAAQYFLVAQENLASFKFEIPDALLNEASKLTEQMLGGQLNPASLLPGQVQGEFDQNFLDQLPPEVLQLIPLIKQNQLPPEIKEEIKKNLPPDMNYEQFKQMIENIPVNEQGQIDVHPDSQTFRSDYLAPVKEQVLNEINTLIEPYKPYLPLVFTVLFFLTLKSFGFIIDGLAVLVLNIFIWIFKVTGLVEEKTLSVEAKRLELKE